MMNRLLIHGVYDSVTFDTLRALGIKDFSFDLRGKSSNLVTLRDLNLLMGKIGSQQVFLTFENDGPEMVLSFLDILKIHSIKCELIFRDVQTPQFYRNMRIPFYWMFNQLGDWKSILSLPNIKGIFLPVKNQEFYKKHSDLWEIVDEMNLDVYLHAENFEEAYLMNLKQELKLSIDLGPEVEKSYRLIDHEKLKNMNFWGVINENNAGQR